MGRFRLLSTATALILCLALSGCHLPVLVVTRGTLRGTGDLVSREFTVGEYTGLRASCPLEVIYSATASDTVTLEIQENLLEYVQINVEDGILQVNSPRSFQIDSGKTPKLYIYTPELRSVRVSGALEMTDADPITGDSLNMEISGACSLSLELEVDSLELRISGAGDAALTGRADDARIRISGAGSLRAEDLKTRSAEVRISGAGDATISVSDTLDAHISGAGSIGYRGNPAVTKKVSGAGSVYPLS